MTSRFALFLMGKLVAVLRANEPDAFGVSYPKAHRSL